MRKLAAVLMFILASTLTACTMEAPHASLTVSTPADECFAEAMAYDPATGDCVPSSFWQDTPGLLYP